jgi:hypothetical protein
MSIVIHGYMTVLLSVPTNGICRGEYGNEVRIQLLRRGGDQPAEAGQVPFTFQVHPPVGSLVAVGHEYLKEMVSNCLVVGLCRDEAARALARWHFVAFPMVIR